MQSKLIRIQPNVVLILCCLLIQFSFAFEPEWGSPLNLRDLNSNKDDFAPSWNPFEKRLYFASDRVGKSKFFTTDDFVKASELRDPLNKATKNVSYISFLSETEAVLNAFRKGKVQAYLNIFYSQRRAGQWQKPIPLDSLQCECFVLHPTVSPSGDFIIFSSDKDTPGKLDLYIAYRGESGIWGNIEKIEELCTEGDEITPFLASRDTLYFASNGLGGPGGFDIFLSIRRGNYWDKPVPLSHLNTRFDESDFVIVNDTLAVYASNNTEGLGGLDLYLARRTTRKELTTTMQTKLELSISVQLPIVRLLKEFEYDMALFPQTVSKAFLLGSVNDLYANESRISSFEDFQKSYFSLLIKRIVNYHVPTKFVFDTTDYRIREFVLDGLKFFSNMHPEVIKLIEFEYSGNDFIVVKCDNDSVFNPVKIGKTKDTYEPPVLEISINARPERLLTTYKYAIRGTNYYRTGSKVPLFASIELTQDNLESLLNPDSLYIDLIAEDTLGNNYFTSYPIILNKTFLSYRKMIGFRGKQYERIFFYTNLYDIDNRVDIKKMLESLSLVEENISEILILGRFESKPTALIEKISSSLRVPLSKILLLTDLVEYERIYGRIPNEFCVILVHRK